MRFIVFMLVFIGAATIAHAQADSSYQLLWYQGKQLKPDVLLTPRGDTVRLDRVKRTINVTNRKSAPSRSAAMMIELNKTSQRMQEAINSISSLPKVVLPPVVELLESSYLEVQDEYATILNSPVTIPDDNDFPAPGHGGKGSAWSGPDDETGWEKAIAELHDDMQKLNAMPLFTSTPKPPVSPLEYGATCRNGDWYKDLWWKNYEFANQMKADEDALRSKALILSYSATKKLEGNELKKVQDEVRATLLFINKRLQRKISQVLNTYGDDPLLARSLMQVVTLIQHEQEANLPDIPFNPAFTYQLCGTMIKAIEKALEERDYPVALNIDFFLRTERYCKVVGYEIPNHVALREKFFRFNQFRLNLHIAAKARGEGGTIETELKGDNWFMAIPNKGTCRLQWVLIGPDLKSMKMDLVKNEMVTKVKIPYVGSKNWMTTIPNIKLDFNFRMAYDGNEGPSGPPQKDSITVYPFYEKDYNELWQFPNPVGVTKVSMSNSVLLGCFLDIERLKEEKNQMPDDMQEKAADMKRNMQAEYAPLIAKYQSQSGAMPVSAADFKKLQQLQQKTTSLTNSIQENLPGKYVFYPSSVADYEKVILEERLDGKVLFPQNPATQFAWFKLKLEHDPSGKFNTFKTGKL